MSSNEIGTPGSWKPVLLRGLIAAGYGTLTIFWQDPGAGVLAVTGALYLLGNGAAIFWLQLIISRQRRRDPNDGHAAAPAGSRTPVHLLQLTALVLGGTGIGLVFQGAGGFGIVAGLGLGAAGVLEFYLGIRHRSEMMSRDWRITGIVNIGAALVLACLPAFTAAEPHALMGVLGGSAIIAAVVLILGALTLRSAAGSAPGAARKAVN